MDKARKKNIKRVISFVCMVALVVVLAAMPLIARQNPTEEGPKESILSGTVSTGSIATELIGGGILAEEEAMTVSVPAAVKLEKFLVSNGDFVSAGTPVAAVDRVTVMTAITQVQETLEYLSKQIEKAGDAGTTEKVNALAGGTVKILYAKKGDSVQNVMLEHGALAVLSLDGLMAVDLDVESQLAVGSAVTVTLSDGTGAEGKIIKNLAGEMTVTVEDRNYPVNDTVQVTAEDGTVLGSDTLYIYSPWNATAYAGTVSNIQVRVGDELRAGRTLMVLEDVGYSAAYRQLITQRQEYEELMLDLFKMYQTETVTAPCDGVVSGVDKNSVQLLTDKGQGFYLDFLANAPNGDDETLYANYVGQVTGISGEGWCMNMMPQVIPVADYKLLSGVPLDTSAMTEAVLHTRTDIPLYKLTQEVWVQIDSSRIGIGDIVLFAFDQTGSPVWGVLLQKAQLPEQPDAPTEPSDPTEPGNPVEPGDPTEPSEPSEPGDPTEPTEPEGSTEPTIPSNPSKPGTSYPGFHYPSGGNWGGLSGMGGMAAQKPAFELYGLDMADIAAVTPQDTITLQIAIDELDIHSLELGMTAQVKIDALGGEKYTAVITKIGNTGTNHGGFSKYSVELTMERTGNMLAGMNATATIVLSTADDVLVVPAKALVEQGNHTVVYTGYDEKQEMLLNPVEVKVGDSDGENAEILEGLANGQTYYYAYYDTLEQSLTPDFGGLSMFG